MSSSNRNSNDASNKPSGAASPSGSGSREGTPRSSGAEKPSGAASPSGSGSREGTPRSSGAEKPSGAASNTAFLQIMKWAGAMMIVAVTLGFLYRIIMPVERQLDEREYQLRVFTEFESDVYASNEPGSPVYGTFEGGSVLYVIAQDSVSGRLLYLVRPFTVSGLDSVWVDAKDVLDYSKEAYRRWQYEEEIRKFGFDKEPETEADSQES